jgi:hypothetical protein
MLSSRQLNTTQRETLPCMIGITFDFVTNNDVNSQDMESKLCLCAACLYNTASSTSRCPSSADTAIVKHRVAKDYDEILYHLYHTTFCLYHLFVYLVQ